MTREPIPLMCLGAALALLVGSGPVAAAGQAAQAPQAAFTATASVRHGEASASFPVRVVVTRWSSDDERSAARDAITKGTTAKALATMKDAGYIEVGKMRTAIKFASQRATGSGRLVTVVTAAPIAFVGAGLPNAKPREGFDVALAILDLKEGDTGIGELAPAAKIGVGAGGSLVTTDYGSTVVWLKDIARETSR